MHLACHLGWYKYSRPHLGKYLCIRAQPSKQRETLGGEKNNEINKGNKYITMKANIQSGKLHNRKDTLPVTRSRDQDPHDAPGALYTK